MAASYPFTLSPLEMSGWAAANISSSHNMDADAEMIAWKHFPQSASPITHIDIHANIGGTITDTNFTVEVQSDSADAPSGTLLGTASAEWAGIAADGWIGEKALATDTGALTIGVPVWIVVKRSSGGSLSATDFFAFRTTAIRKGLEKLRHHNGTNWTTSAAQLATPIAVVKHSNGDYVGHPITAINAASGEADIFGTNRLGLKMRFGCQVKIQAIKCQISKTGSPANLECVIYEGSTEKYSTSIAAAVLVNSDEAIFWFSSAVLLAANTDIYIILRQASNGGDNSNDYDLRSFAVNAAYIDAIVPSNWRMVAGTGDDPTAFTVQTDEVAVMLPILVDTALDLDETASGGGGAALGGVKVIHPGHIIVQ